MSGTGVTSGTVSNYRFNNQKIIDHAMRRAGLQPEHVSAEQQQIALDLLLSQTSEWIAAGFPLWTRQFLLLGCTIGSPDVPTPNGTVDVFHSYWRILQPFRGNATLTTGGGASVLFAGQPNPDVPITATNPGVIANFGSPTQLDTVGVLLGGSSSVTAALQLFTSPDGSTFTLAQTLPSATYSPQTWVYFDLNPSLQANFISIVLPSTMSTTWTLNQLNFGLANSSNIELGPENIDDYWNLPNLQFQSDRPTISYTDRQLKFPVLKIWPTLNTQGFYNGTVTALVRRYIQDPGQLTNALEVPQRWLEATIWRLATNLFYEIPPMENPANAGNPYALLARNQLIQQIEQKAAKSEALAWSSETTRGPIRLAPNISAYTR